MDIYGIKKSIQVIEQVYLDMTKVFVRPMCTRVYNWKNKCISRHD